MEQKKVGGDWDKRLFKAVNDDIYLPEVFKTLRSRILHPGDDSTSPKTIMITSVIHGEGKSFVTANLGISLALGMDQHSLLVDCDLRCPTLAPMFGHDIELGLVDYLSEKNDIGDLIRKTSIDKLSIMSSGTPPQNPAELLSSERMKVMMEELAGRYDDRLIIFDTPPARVASETVVLARQVDAVILVVREGGTGREDLQKIVDVIGPEKIIGIVFNAKMPKLFEKSVVQYSKDYYYRAGK